MHLSDKNAQIDIGIIGGSGIYTIEGLLDIKELTIDTPFGPPSDKYMTGILNGVRVAFLARHGRGHIHLPSELNYRANIYGFKVLGVQKLIGVTAVGSLREDRPPLDMVVPDQLIDRTRGRISTFFGDGVAAHVSFADPFCKDLAEVLYTTASGLTKRVHRGGTLVTIEGPAFSTRAESILYRQWGCDIIGMTTCQEAKLAREAEICYAPLAMVTDYDCWRESDEGEVTVETVIANMAHNTELACKIITNILPELIYERECGCSHSLRGAIMTSSEAIPAETRKRLSLLIQHRL